MATRYEAQTAAITALREGALANSRLTRHIKWSELRNGGLVGEDSFGTLYVLQAATSARGEHVGWSVTVHRAVLGFVSVVVGGGRRPRGRHRAVNASESFYERYLWGMGEAVADGSA